MEVNNKYEDMDNRSNTDDLIINYFSEGLKDAELLTLQKWIESSAENKNYFNRQQELWFSCIAAKDMSAFDSQQALNYFFKRTAPNKQQIINKEKMSIGRRSWSVAVAVVLALLFITSYVTFKQANKQILEQFADVVIEAPIGSRTKMYLPDGTLVWLNCDSKITYSQGFGVKDREVTLSGEAYFEVEKNEEQSFIVKTEELKVTVLGTKFNVKNYPKEDEVAITLQEGSIVVCNNLKEENDIRLSPNQMVFLNKHEQKMRIVNVNASNSMEWTNGYLFFDEVLLADIIKELERNYNVNIMLEDNALETFRFYGNFDVREQTIEEVLDVLTRTNKVNYKIEGRKIYLNSKE